MAKLTSNPLKCSTCVLKCKCRDCKANDICVISQNVNCYPIFLCPNFGEGYRYKITIENLEEENKNA